jgi:hypothetical protein
MAARDGAASVQGDMIRITPLETDGSRDVTKPVLTAEGFISASFAPEFEDGDEITEKAANGNICIQYKADDSMKGITFNLSLCSPDPEAANILSGGKVLYTDTPSVAVGLHQPGSRRCRRESRRHRDLVEGDRRGQARSRSAVLALGVPVRPGTLRRHA